MNISKCRDFSDVIKRIKLHENLNQTELANRIGVTRTTISMIETGSRLPSSNIIDKISRRFNIDKDMLIDIYNKSIEVAA